MDDTDLLSCWTFREALLRCAWQRPSYDRVLDAMEAAGVIDCVTELGDEVLRRLRKREVSRDEALYYLAALIDCVERPLAARPRVAALGMQIRSKR